MSLVVVSQKNHLPTSANSFFVHTAWSDTIEYDSLVDIMASGRTTLTKPDIAGCLELLTEEVMKLVADGKYVKFPLGSFYLCAAGKLDSADQAFTPQDSSSEHALRLHFRADRSIETQLLAMARVERGASFDRSAPLIKGAVSVRSETDMRALPGDFLRVSGERLKFDKSQDNTGLFFVNGHETRAIQYASITPPLVIAQVPPELVAGEYQLAFRSYQGGKALHECRCPTPFIVE